MQDTPSTPPNLESSGIDASATASAPGQEGQVETSPSPEELLRQIELKAAEHHDAWLRAKAETENLRRRAQEDVAKAHKYAAEKFAAEMLPVKDSLEAALLTANDTVDNLRNGVGLTLKQLSAAFEKFGLAEINPAGDKFDPHQHQAINTQEDEGEPNRVLTVLQKGYSLNDRVIRPALVIVSKARGA